MVALTLRILQHSLSINMFSTSSKRVAITGLGLVSPIGSSLEQVWESLRLGRSGISAIDSLPTASLPVKSGGQVKAFTGAIEDYGDLDKGLQRSIKKNMKVMCRVVRSAVLGELSGDVSLLVNPEAVQAVAAAVCEQG